MFISLYFFSSPSQASSRGSHCALCKGPLFRSDFCFITTFHRWFNHSSWSSSRAYCFRFHTLNIYQIFLQPYVQVGRLLAADLKFMSFYLYNLNAREHSISGFTCCPLIICVFVQPGNWDLVNCFWWYTRVCWGFLCVRPLDHFLLSQPSGYWPLDHYFLDKLPSIL